VHEGEGVRPRSLRGGRSHHAPYWRWWHLLVTTAALGAGALALGLSWRPALVAGFGLSLSSTAAPLLAGLEGMLSGAEFAAYGAVVAAVGTLLAARLIRAVRLTEAR